ncbi:unnamed protein product, partial [Timema podura]|nr:unnamed protein product [Timema podura]
MQVLLYWRLRQHSSAGVMVLDILRQHSYAGVMVLDILIQQSSAEKVEIQHSNLLARFRCNLAVQGKKPFEENEWTNIQIGEVRFQSEGMCTRCQMVCIDQSTGEKTREPLHTIAASFQGKMRFGMYFSHRNETHIFNISKAWKNRVILDNQALKAHNVTEEHWDRTNNNAELMKPPLEIPMSAVAVQTEDFIYFTFVQS